MPQAALGLLQHYSEFLEAIRINVSMPQAALGLLQQELHQVLVLVVLFRCRKRHQVCCNRLAKNWCELHEKFRCRKRHQVCCNAKQISDEEFVDGFDAASGIRSVATLQSGATLIILIPFRCRKRHQVCCNTELLAVSLGTGKFRCRKRHQVCCNNGHRN